MAVWQGDSTGVGGVNVANALSRLRADFSDEARRLVVWTPVLLVFGIWAYFGLSTEPSRLALFVVLLVAAILLWLGRSNRAVMAIGLVLLGFGLAKLRMDWVATPLVRAYSANVQLTGIVSEIERRGPVRHIAAVDVISAQGVAPDEVPRRVRLQMNIRGAAPQVGDTVQGEAVLLPLPLPVAPGAFDYGRSLYFQSIGATGRMTGEVRVLQDAAPWNYRLRRGFHDLRRGIGDRVRAVIPGPLGAFADALITGERAAIPREMNNSLQVSGLFHILSISGLHMAMVVGSSFWVIRALLALHEGLALRWPIKKWAASAAIVVGAFYMLLADSGAATERSFIMVAVMLFAVLVDRPAVSLRNLAIAAVLILAFAPEQAIQASFQMSFLAVMGLAGFFEWWNSRQQNFESRKVGFVWRWSRKLLLLVLASLITSVIAGGLSGIAAAHHFGRIAPFGVVANALALPVVSIVIMPSALLSVLAMPFGMERLPLLVMEQGLRLLMIISDWVAGWPKAGVLMPLLSAPVAALLAIAAACIAIGRSWVKVLAVPAFVLAMWFGLTPQTHDILIDERVRTVAARNEAGELVPLTGKMPSFAIGRWLSADGDQSSPRKAGMRKLWSCSASTCRATVQAKSVVVLKGQGPWIGECPKADILIAQFPLRRRCKGKDLTVDRFDVWRNGSYSISLDGIVVTKTARGEQGARPWQVTPRARSAK
jgi:competence protein ComEC